MFSFFNPWNHQKIKGFQVFWGVLKQEHWPEMGWFNLECLECIIWPTKGLASESNLVAGSLHPKHLYLCKLINLKIIYPSNFPESDSGRISILSLNMMLRINYHSILPPKIYYYLLVTICLLLLSVAPHINWCRK